MKVRFKLASYAAMLLSCVISLPALADNTSELSGFLNGMNTMRATFTQTIYDNYGKPVQKSTGRMALSRPGRFRWEVSQPMPQTIIANGERLWIYDPDLQQVTIRSLKTEAGEAPALLLSHQNTSLDKEYDISVMAKEKPLHWFLLKPKKKDAMFAMVKMGFAGPQLQEMILQDQIGHDTRVQFTKVETNVNLPASLFTFKAPSGTDVIDETHR